MTVSSQNTTITNAETGDSANWDDIGGGPGSGQSTDNPYQGSEDRGRRVDNVVRGFSFDSTTGIDISGAGVHVLFALWVIQPQLIGAGGVELDIGDNASPQAGNWDGHTFAAADYPPTASWLFLALDPTRTRDVGAGTLSLSSVRQFGVEFDMGDISGTSENCHVDRIAYGTGGYQQVGTSVGFAEFRTYEDNNREGILNTVGGIDFLTSRLQWGSAGTAITGDQTLAVVFSTQPLAASDFMGLDVDLQNASTALTLRGFVRSGDPTGNRGDLQVVGASGALTLRGSFTELREVVLTSTVTVDEGATLGAQSITPSTATLDGITILTESATSVACITSPSFSDMSYVAFVQAGAGHAYEIASAGTYNLTGLTHSGYGANTTDSAAIDVTAASGTVTLNIGGGGDTPTYKTAGATVVINNSKTHTVTGLDAGSLVVWVRKSDDVELHSETASGGTASYTYNYVSDTDVFIQILDLNKRNRIIDPVTLGNADATLPAGQADDPFYLNP